MKINYKSILAMSVMNKNHTFVVTVINCTTKIQINSDGFNNLPRRVQIFMPSLSKIKLHIEIEKFQQAFYYEEKTVYLFKKN